MAENTFKLTIVTPERIFYDGDVEMVEMNTTEGEIGVYKGHVPTTVIVNPGVLKIHEEAEVKKAALHSGFVEILEDKVTILAEVIEWPDEIDFNRAEEARIKAERHIEDSEEGIDIDKEKLALLRAITRISASDKNK